LVGGSEKETYMLKSTKKKQRREKGGEMKCVSEEVKLKNSFKS